MTDLLPPSRPRPHGQPVHVHYEKAGLTLPGPPVPWNAEAVVVELALRLPPAGRHRSDFTLRMPGHPPYPAEALKRDDADERVFRVFFRLPNLPASTAGEVLWRHRLLTPVPLPVQSADQYLTDLRLAHPTVSVRVGGRYVAARTFVASQCKGLSASAVVRSAAGLAPLADLGLAVVFRAERTGTEHAVPVPLSSSQLAGKEALLTASPPKFPRQSGDYTVVWRAGRRDLLSQRVTAVTGRRFVQSLRVADARFVVADNAGGEVRTARQPPNPGDPVRVGPCFVVASREAGAAGLVDLCVTTQGPGSSAKQPVVLQQSVLVTDGPTVFAPGLLDPADLASVVGFELRHKGQVLGQLSFRPVPMAGFNAEGAFKPPPDFSWSTAAEDELADRLGKLMGGGQ